MQITYKQIFKRYNKIILPLILLLLLAGVVVILEKTRITNLITLNNKPTQPIATKPAETTSKEKTAQSSFSEGEPRSTETTQKKEGIITDNKGSVSNTPPESQWITSQSGLITVYTPAENGVLKSGQVLSGTSKSDRISFRLIDDVSGVISQGSVSVVKGKFSGTFDFATQGVEGRVDVFTAAPDGTESNNVSIPVRFK